MRYNLHSKAIDALRGIAAAAVFFDHSDTSGLATNAWFEAHKGLMGDFGVYVFFCLSGYLIWQSGTRLVGKPDGIKLYAIHRLTRLVPLYLINLLFVTVAIGYIGSRWTPDYDAWVVFRHLIFSQDLYPSVSRGINPVLWTLTHEALFYILVPIMLMAGIRNKYMILAASLTIYAVFLSYGWLEYFKFAQIFYAFALGIFIADASSKARFVVCLASISLAIYACFDATMHPYVGRIIAIAFALSCISLTKGKECNQMASQLMSPLVFLGVISYSMYIWHYQIIYVVEYYYPFFNRHVPGWSQYGIISGVILCSICILFSYASYVFIEKPSMGRLRVAMENKTGARTALA
ncbi:acyltransferase family protein [Pseudomonas vlassakiae]|uniref:Acyltransferase n=1 Tax=Pseudomonas vlassakiae TaxID=485888 RepID=A0A923GH27_9PSED|nr:acyltransferase [Pseudomonas vlassakiae]MBV4539612.1 acyltransferase [Pseudomonas vlassakiae]